MLSAAVSRFGDGGRRRVPGGMVGPHERAQQLDLARTEAVAAGRDPGALEYTRWGSIDMPAERVDGLAAAGVTRIVVGSTDPDNPFDEMSRFAERFELGG
ncbi:hypothetical protein [Nocardia sp. CS682]|uniref:hypothetical protein n=1 Tax=Nocardia sp. CS682 TaxID=1047172 RepID=UPI001074FDE6|nr:hypothetical protein [Nocardia sp. CS682]QBS40602.1 hypothetical protein DMB37_11165 [Nocardia sp. CS682]